MTTRTRTLSVEDVGFFEGAEKLLEVWFQLDPEGHVGAENNTKKGLRLIPRYQSVTLQLL